MSKEAFDKIAAGLREAAAQVRQDSAHEWMEFMDGHVACKRCGAHRRRDGKVKRCRGFKRGVLHHAR